MPELVRQHDAGLASVGLGQLAIAVCCRKRCTRPCNPASLFFCVTCSIQACCFSTFRVTLRSAACRLKSILPGAPLDRLFHVPES